MVKKDKVLLTKKGLKDLKKKHKHLVEVKRPQAVKRLADAREMGDLTENSEYTAARQDLAFIDRKIAELEKVLDKAEVVKSSNKGKKITIGSQATLKMDGQKVKFQLVGDWEADPSKNKISVSSPIGKALMGKKIDDQVEVNAPAGRKKYQVLKIS